MCGFVYKTQLFAKSPKIQYVSNVLCALGPTLRWDSNHLEISVSVQTLSPTIHIAPICLRAMYEVFGDDAKVPASWVDGPTHGLDDHAHGEDPK